jgi:hypothetical protein
VPTLAPSKSQKCERIFFLVTDYLLSDFAINVNSIPVPLTFLVG